MGEGVRTTTVGARKRGEMLGGKKPTKELRSEKKSHKSEKIGYFTMDHDVTVYLAHLQLVFHISRSPAEHETTQKPFGGWIVSSGRTMFSCASLP